MHWKDYYSNSELNVGYEVTQDTSGERVLQDNFTICDEYPRQEIGVQSTFLYGGDDYSIESNESFIEYNKSKPELSRNSLLTLLDWIKTPNIWVIIMMRVLVEAALTFSEPSNQNILGQLACNYVAVDGKCNVDEARSVVKSYDEVISYVSFFPICLSIFYLIARVDQYGYKVFYVIILLKEAIKYLFLHVIYSRSSTLPVVNLVLLKFFTAFFGNESVLDVLVLFFLIVAVRPERRLLAIGLQDATTNIGVSIGRILMDHFNGGGPFKLTRVSSISVTSFVPFSKANTQDLWNLRVTAISFFFLFIIGIFILPEHKLYLNEDTHNHVTPRSEGSKGRIWNWIPIPIQEFLSPSGLETRRTTFARSQTSYTIMIVCCYLEKLNISICMVALYQHFMNNGLANIIVGFQAFSLIIVLPYVSERLSSKYHRTNTLRNQPRMVDYSLLYIAFFFRIVSTIVGCLTNNEKLFILFTCVGGFSWYTVVAFMSFMSTFVPLKRIGGYTCTMLFINYLFFPLSANISDWLLIKGVIEDIPKFSFYVSLAISIICVLGLWLSDLLSRTDMKREDIIPEAYIDEQSVSTGTLSPSLPSTPLTNSPLARIELASDNVSFYNIS